MLSRIRNVMILLRGQMWLIPAIMMALSLVLAYLLLDHGHLLRASAAADLWWLYGGDASSARELFSSLLTGMITMNWVGMTFRISPSPWAVV